MGRQSRKKTTSFTHKKNISVLSYMLFFLGSIGEVVLFPIKFILRGTVFVFRYSKQSLEDFYNLQNKAQQKMDKLLPRIDKKNKSQHKEKKTSLKEVVQEGSNLFQIFLYTVVKIIRWMRKEIILSTIDIHWKKHQTIKQKNKKQQNASQKNITDQKKTNPLMFIIKSISLIMLGGLLMLLITMTIEFSSFLQSLPNPKLLTNRDIPLTTKLFDRNGILLYEFYIDENRTLIPLSDIPKIMKQATIAIEDREFYTHQGFSIRGIIRAARETFLNDNRQGGSTITQQLIKSTLLTPEISFRRKIKEVILAIWAEQIYTKDQILEMYLNQVPYGGTAWGVESASQTFFGKSAKDLTLSEAALLAGLPAAPSEYSPFGANREKGISRQHEVLKRMVEEHFITEKEAEEAKKEPLVFASPRIPIRAPHFVLYARDYLLKRYGERQVLQGGLQVTTTLDAKLQDTAQQIVATEIEKLKPLSVGNGAVLVTDPKTGGILAMVGSKNYFDTQADGNVNVTTSLRQPGSSIKVVTYTAALEKGFTAASLLDDSPVVYRSQGQPPYAPVNYDGRWRGLVPLRYALGNSYNIPAVKVLDAIGISSMIEKGKSMGIDTWQDPSRFGLSLALGGGEVTMLDMAEVYGTLANEGKRFNLSPILEIKDSTGKILEENTISYPLQATTPAIAWILSNILSDNTARTQAFGPNSQLVIPGKTVSVKTGTTNDKRDNWTIGYTPSYVVAVWVGNNDNKPMNPQLTSGITGAAPIWQQVMKELLKNRTDETIPKPDDVYSIPCYFGKQEYFVKGTEPKEGRCQNIPTPTISPTP